MDSLLTDEKATLRSASRDRPAGQVEGAVAWRLWMMLPFLILFYFQLVHHQMWRDEMNAWGLVIASPTLRALLANVHYEVHPALWYLLLYPGSKFTHGPWMLKLVEGCIGTGIYLLFALAAPYRRLEQLLIYCSYFVVFEYTVMSRMYSVMVLFMLVYLWSRVKYPDRPLLNAFWLGMMANTDVNGMILSGGLLLEYWIDGWMRRREESAQQQGVWPAMLWKSGVVYLGLVVLSAATLWPAKDLSWRTTGRMFSSARDSKHLLISVANYLAVPWFPLRAFTKNFWDLRALGHLDRYLILSPIILGCVWMVFRKRRSLLVMFGSVAVTGILFNHLIYNGSLRHFGIVFLAFLAGLWMLRARGALVSRAAYFLLALNALAGMAAVYAQRTHPFADDDDAAAWILQHHMENATLIGVPDTSVVGLPERLQRPMYFLDCRCVDTFMRFSSRRDSFHEETDLVPRLVGAVHELHAPVMVLVTIRELSKGELQGMHDGGLKLDPLAAFTRGDVWDEHFYLYRVSAISAGAATSPQGAE